MDDEWKQTLAWAEAEYIDSGTFQAGEEDCSRVGLTQRGAEAAVVRLDDLLELVRAARYTVARLAEKQDACVTLRTALQKFPEGE